MLEKHTRQIIIFRLPKGQRDFYAEKVYRWMITIGRQIFGQRRKRRVPHLSGNVTELDDQPFASSDRAWFCDSCSDYL
jgi:hypothetical protein